MDYFFIAAQFFKGGCLQYKFFALNAKYSCDKFFCDFCQIVHYEAFLFPSAFSIDILPLPIE